MKNKRNVLYGLIIMLAGVINFPVQAQQKNGAQDSVKTKASSQGPNGIVRTIKQDRKGNIWITSWEGVYKYDGKSFTNITSEVSSARFFSVLEDRKGNFWFASIGSGVYYYDARLNDGVGQGTSLPAGQASFRNFTTGDGLAGNEVTNIYEDKTGAVWFGTGNGASRYDARLNDGVAQGKSLPDGQVRFQNFKMSEAPPVTATDSVYVGPPVHIPSDSVFVGTPAHAQADSVHISFNQNPLPKVHWMHNDVNAIMEDNTGKFWFGTRGYATVYDGKTFTVITNKDGKPFLNVRAIIKDKKGNIWLGGADGLWRYDGSTFTNYTQNFVGYIYEDKKGNIWTSSERANAKDWTLSRYDEKTLNDKKPTATTIANKPMIFGILEDDKGDIWFGSLDGVYRYDARLNDGVGQGKIITDFKSKEGQK
jgi:ligand-binding sensor domain-containing protein